MNFCCSFLHDVNLQVKMIMDMIIGTEGIEKTRNNKGMERSLAENDYFITICGNLFVGVKCVPGWKSSWSDDQTI